MDPQCCCRLRVLDKPASYGRVDTYIPKANTVMDYVLAILIVMLVFWVNSISNHHANIKLLKIAVDAVDRACVHLHNNKELDHKINSTRNNRANGQRDMPAGVQN